MKDIIKDFAAPIFFVTLFIGVGFGIYADCNRRKVAQAEAAPPTPPAFSVQAEETLPDSAQYVRTRIVTDTATKRQYILVYTSSGIAITPRLPAETP